MPERTNERTSKPAKKGRTIKSQKKKESKNHQAKKHTHTHTHTHKQRTVHVDAHTHTQKAHTKSTHKKPKTDSAVFFIGSVPILFFFSLSPSLPRSSTIRMMALSAPQHQHHQPYPHSQQQQQQQNQYDHQRKHHSEQFTSRPTSQLQFQQQGRGRGAQIRRTKTLPRTNPAPGTTAKPAMRRSKSESILAVNNNGRSKRQNKPKKTVRFGTTVVRKYPIILGDHPECPSGPAVSRIESSPKRCHARFDVLSCSRCGIGCMGWTS